MEEKKSYIKAYIWSVLLPPIGCYYFFKYFIFGDGSNDDLRAGIISTILTVVSLIINIWLIGLLFNQPIPGISGEGGSLNTLKELITPQNQKELQQLFQ